MKQIAEPAPRIGAGDPRATKANLRNRPDSRDAFIHGQLIPALRRGPKSILAVGHEVNIGTPKGVKRRADPHGSRIDASRPVGFSRAESVDADDCAHRNGRA
jgi:hypothetical protein